MVSLGLVTHDHLEGECGKVVNPLRVFTSLNDSRQDLNVVLHRDSEQKAGEEEKNDGKPRVQRRRV